MAGKKTGTWTIVQDAVHMTRIGQKYGASDLEVRTSTAFYNCYVALAQCVVELLATDDYLLMKDASAPLGPEDIGGP